MPNCRRRVLFMLIAGAIALPAAARAVRESPVRFAQGLLWRVARRAIAASHIFGTIHLADPRVLDVPDPVMRALSHSRRYFMETHLAAAERARFFEAAQFEDGRRIEPLIGAETFARLAAHLREGRLPEEVIERIKPWAALANLTITPEDYAAEPLDQKLLALARSFKLRIDALEGIEEQISVFDGIPMETQVALLKHAIEHRDDFVGLIEPTIQAWLRRDLAALDAVNQRIAGRYPDVAEHYRELFRRVVRNRSIVMAHRLFVPLRRGRLFIAVGASHLYGEEGLLRLIERQGYRIERVY